MKVQFSLVALSVITAAQPAVAVAQGANSTRPATPADSLADIVVTARRSAENVQKVPITVQAFNANSLREASISTPQDLQLRTPGIFTNGSGTVSNTSYSIRGQGRPLVGIGQAAVISYISDVPLPTPASGQPQYDMASIQVLKGPQGTLFGRNTTGGAILFYPQAPTYRSGGYVEGSLGNYNYRSSDGALNIPISEDKVALRVAGRFAKRDGFVKNLGVGRDFNDLNNYSGRISLLIEPTSGIKNLTIADYYHQSEAGPAQIFSDIFPGSLLDRVGGTTSPRLPDILANQKLLGIRKTISAVDPFDRIVAKGLSNRTDVDLSGVSLSNIFGYRTVDFSNAANYDGLPPVNLFGGGLGPVIKSYRADAYNQLTEELQIKGKLLQERLQWLLGGFYLNSKPGGENVIRVDSFGSMGVANATFVHETSKALFANASYKLTANLTVNAGARYTWDGISVCTGVAPGLSEPYAARNADCRAGLLENSAQTKSKFSRPTWTVGLDWQLTPDVFNYVTSRRGYRAGGVNTPVLGVGLASYQTFKPETITDVEIGTKGKWRAGTIQGLFSVALFYARSKDVQYNVNSLVTDPSTCTPATNFDKDCNPRNDPSGTSLTFNAGTTSVKGLEASFTVIPVKHLTLDIGGSFLRPKTDRVNFGSLAPYIAAGGDSLNQIPFRFVPKQTVAASARYEVPLNGESAVVFNADYYWSGKIVYGYYEGPSYNVINLRVDWNNVAGRPVDLSLFARNALQQKYTSTVGLAAYSPGTSSVVYGDPRMYGIQARFRFGS